MLHKILLNSVGATLLISQVLSRASYPSVMKHLVYSAVYLRTYKTGNFCFPQCFNTAFSALALLLAHQEEHPACKV